MRSALRPLLLAAMLSVLTSAAAADVVHLVDGGRLEGTVRSADDDAVVVELSAGTVTVPRDRVARIERGGGDGAALDEAASRLGDSGTVRAWLALAAEARELGDTAREGRYLDRARSLDPEDAGASEAWTDWRRLRRELPDEPERREAVAALLGESVDEPVQVLVGDHWRLAWTGSPRRARETLQLLEATLPRFYEFADTLGLETTVPSRRLDAVLYPDHAAWLDALGPQPGGLHEVAGLYRPSDGRILLYDTTTRPDVQQALASVQDDAEELTEDRRWCDSALADLERVEHDLGDRLQVGRFPTRPHVHELHPILERLLAEARRELAELDGALARTNESTEDLPGAGGATLRESDDRHRAGLARRRAQGRESVQYLARVLAETFDDGGEPRELTRPRLEAVAGLVEQLGDVLLRRRTSATRRIDAAAAERARLSDRFVATRRAAVTHEAFHQLSFATGLLGPDSPVWLHEGLASHFEADDLQRFVPVDRDRERLGRVGRLWADAPQGRLAALLTGETFKRRPVQAYDEAHAVIWWLVRRDRPLADLIREGGGERSIAVFRELVGELDDIELEIARFLRQP